MRLFLRGIGVGAMASAALFGVSANPALAGGAQVVCAAPPAATGVALTPPAPPPAASAKPVAVSGSYDATIVSMGAGRANLCVTLPTLPDARRLDVPTKDLRIHLVDAAVGDIAKIEVDDAASPTKVTAISEIDRPVGKGPRFLALGGSALLLAGFLAIVTRFKPQSLLIGVDNRYSNSQVQLALWFGVVAVIYGAAVALRLTSLGSNYIGGVGLTDHIIALTGLSALTFGGAKVITAQKAASADAAHAAGVQQQNDAAVNAANQPVGAAALAPTPPPPAPAAVLKVQGPEPRLLTDLVSNDANEADLGDVQMILVTLAAVAIFLLTAFHFLGRLPVVATMTLPDVDTSLLALFGLGQGAYLIKKAAMPLGRG